MSKGKAGWVLKISFVLAKNIVWYRNLVKLTFIAHLEGMWSREIFART